MPRKILIIAAHPDDEVLGCGGTIARHSHEGGEVKVIFMADGIGARPNNFEDTLRERKDSAYNALKLLGVNTIQFFDFPDNQLDTIPLLSLVQKIENVIKDFQPEIVYTHHYGDLNIDHQMTHRATMTACRPLPYSSVKEIYAYEILSSSEWALNDNFFKPQCFIDITNFIEQKIKALEIYEQEMRQEPHPRSFKAVQSLAILRGAQVGRHDCEAFEILRYIHD